MAVKAKKKTKVIAKAKKPELIDPRQIAFVSGYTDPKSPTYGNAYASAIAAKYSESYAKSITLHIPEAISEIIGNDRRVMMAEKHLDEVLEMPVLVQAMGAFGPLVKKIPTGKFKTVKNKKTGKEEKQPIMREEPIMVHNTKLIAEKTKVADIVLPALKKAVYGKQAGVKVGFNFNITPSSGREQFS